MLSRPRGHMENQIKFGGWQPAFGTETKPALTQCQWRPPVLLPSGWRKVANMVVGHGVKLVRTDALMVILTTRIEADGNEWVHLSASYPMRLPSYDDLRAVKFLFLGEERPAYQVFPPKSEHFNLHPFCLHLWARADGSPALPDFRIAGGI